MYTILTFLFWGVLFIVVGGFLLLLFSVLKCFLYLVLYFIYLNKNIYK